MLLNFRVIGNLWAYKYLDDKLTQICDIWNVRLENHNTNSEAGQSRILEEKAL